LRLKKKERQQRTEGQCREKQPTAIGRAFKREEQTQGSLSRENNDATGKGNKYNRISSFLSKKIMVYRGQRNLKKKKKKKAVGKKILENVKTSGKSTLLPGKS